MDANEAKIETMENAAILAAGIVCGVLAGNGGKLPDGTPVTLDLRDQGTQRAVLAAYELAKAEHTGLVRAVQDRTGVWPDVAVSSAAAGNPEAALGGILGVAGLPAPVGVLIQQALALLKNPQQAVPVPAPGSDLAGTAR